MRLKLGRPDLGAYSARLNIPAASPATPLSVAWAGVTTLLVDDGISSVMTDGFFTRPGLFTVGTQPLASSQPRIKAGLSQLGVTDLDAVIPVHTHYDHAMDSAPVAQQTGARLVGGTSAGLIGRGYGLDRVEVVESGGVVTAGNFDITLIEGGHCPPDRFPGAITAPVVPPARASAYKCGDAWSMLVDHRPTGRKLLIVGSAGCVPGALAGLHADVAYLGIGQLGLQSTSYITEYWTQTVRMVGARRVVLTHWDDFFRSLDKPLRALPFAVDDLDISMRVLTDLAAGDGVDLHLPTLWSRTDPWN